MRHETWAELPAYKQAMRCDPCAYCGEPGGTVDHILPKPKLSGPSRGEWTNITGACVRCNIQKDKGGDRDLHRSVLEQLLATQENHRRVFKLDPSRRWPIGAVVRGPFFDRGVICGFDGPRVLVSIPERSQVWTCINLNVLRSA